jgi:hypothetical protein
MKSIPFVLTVLLSLWFSAIGTEPFMLAVASTGAMLLSWLVSLFLPWSRREAVTLQRVHSGKRIVGWSVLLYVSILVTQWPLRLTFALSRPALEQMAQSLRSGNKLQGPQRAGFFLIREASFKFYPDTVCLWIALEPNGNRGFIQGPSNVMQSASHIWLDKRWRLVEED